MTPEEDTRQRILRGAAQVFAEKGYKGATTQAIADAAGVNEVTLFRHFGTKQNLFRTLIAGQSPLSSVRQALESELTGDYRTDLLTMGRHFMAAMLRQRKEILMSLCAAEQLPELGEAIGQMPAQLRRALGGYFREQMARGAMREMDAEMAAQAFFGMFFAFSISQSLIGELPVSEEAIVEQFVEIFVAGTLK